MQAHYPSEDISALDESSLCSMNQLISNVLNSKCESFSDELIKTIQETNGPELLN